MSSRHDSPDAGVLFDLSGALDSMLEGIQVVGFDWRYLYLNETAASHGRRLKAELLGSTMQEAYPGIEHTDMFRRLGVVMTERRAERMENEFTFPDGSKGWFELRMEPVPLGALILSVDVTERKHQEAQLRHAQKMESLGRLAGGVAHDFNNLLTAIMSFGQFAKDDLPEGSRALEEIDEMLGAATRAESLTRQLLAFSRQQPMHAEVVDLNTTLASLEKLLRRLLGESITLTVRMGSDPWPVRVDPGAIEQVVVNLVVNARDATPDGGRIIIETENVEVTDAQVVAKGGVLSPGDYFLLAVSDNGTGMTPEVCGQAFDPFFTTKTKDKGTGLGLSTSYGIVRQFGGHISVYSEPGMGTTFKVYLPRTDAQASRGAARESRDERAGSGTVLVVEDDAQVRRLVERTLGRGGYRAIVASTIAEATRILDDASMEISLMITDVSLPGGSGAELARHAVVSRPDLRVLLMSGYTAAAVGSDSGATPFEFLSKPFGPTQLLDRVAKMLG